MQQTTNYNLLIPEGADIVNPLTQVNPNFQTIDGAMFANKQASIGTASEVVTGTVHAIIRNNTNSDVFRFTATGAWTAGDTMTLDGQSVTVHLSDGTTPATGAYIIGAEVVGVVNGTLVTLLASRAAVDPGVTSFNTRTGAVIPAISDYDASMVDYDNTGSGLNATDTQAAIDELSARPIASDDYSQTEHVVGTWTDGSKLYEKTIFSTGTGDRTFAFTSEPISVKYSDANISYLSYCVTPYYMSGSDYWNYYLSYTDSLCHVRGLGAAMTNVSTVTLTIRYTKTP